MRRRTFEVPGGVDLARTLRGCCAGRTDPTMRVGPGEVWRATRTRVGPGTVRLVQESSTRVAATAWGDGADLLLDEAPALAGADDDPAAFSTRHPLLRDLARRGVGMRMPRSSAVAEALVPTILEQKVQTAEAYASWRRIVRFAAARAPGPASLLLPPDPAVLARTPYFTFHRAGVEKRRTDVIRHVALRARRLDEAAAMPLADAYRRITAIPGVGAWTAGVIGQRVLGDADAVPVGDFHLPHQVAFALAGEARADDARMLELLEPFRPHRGRVVRLLVSSGIAAPRLGPRMARGPFSPLGPARLARA